MAQYGASIMNRRQLEPARNAYVSFVVLPRRLPALAHRYLFDRSSFYQDPRTLRGVAGRSVTILYLTDIRFPLERANGVHSMETCASLAERGATTSTWWSGPIRRRRNGIPSP